jgi:hypothetical protein
MTRYQRSYQAKSTTALTTKDISHYIVLNTNSSNKAKLNDTNDYVAIINRIHMVLKLSLPSEDFSRRNIYDVYLIV